MGVIYRDKQGVQYQCSPALYMLLIIFIFMGAYSILIIVTNIRLRMYIQLYLEPNYLLGRTKPIQNRGNYLGIVSMSLRSQLRISKQSKYC